MNFDKYIGLPYQENGRNEAGVDCWGLARLVYKNELSIDLPDYSDLYSGNWDKQVTKLINEHKDSWAQVTKPQIGDLCLFNIYGEPAHLGIYVGDNKFLHSRDGSNSSIESLSSSIWKKRLVGFFKYIEDKSDIQLVGAPHPLKIATVSDTWHIAGSTLQDIVEFIHSKYEINKTIGTRLVLMLDGVPVPQDRWANTVIQAGQNVSYRVLAKGRGNGRLLVQLAVLIAVTYVTQNTELGKAAALAVGGGNAALGASIIVMAASTATAVLQNAVAPIRPPDPGKDPGQANQLNLFNGSSNQANRLGAIPIVLGKIRYTGLLGAAPYIETHTNTNILNLLIIWGFGPLDIDPKSISVGAVPLEEAFYDDTTERVELPRTLYGVSTETEQDIARFNELYPNDVEQVFKNVELQHNTTAGNPWQELEFTQPGTRVDIAFTYPEGMRTLKTRGNGAGDVSEATCSVEVQVVKVGESFADTPALNPGGGNSAVTAYSATLTCTGIAQSSTDVYGEAQTSTIEIYRWYTICIGPGGVITHFAGTATDDPDQDPSPVLQAIYVSGEYGQFLNINQTYSKDPVIPPGFIPLYKICLKSAFGLLTDRTVSYIQGSQGYTGLVFGYQNVTQPAVAVSENGPTDIPTGDVKVTISGGSFYPETAPINGQVSTTNIFTTSTTSVIGTVGSLNNRYWSGLLNTHGIWISGSSTFDKTVQVTLPKTGFYDFVASGDDNIKITFNNITIIDVVDAYKNEYRESQYYIAGTYSLRIQGSNAGGGAAGVALKITYTENAGLNIPRSPKTIFTVGTGSAFPKRKDPFNYVYSVKDLPRAKYKLRVRRADPETVETAESEYRSFNKVVFSNAISFDNRLPTVPLPRGKLAQTAIRVQSTGRANGQVDGINAVVQTKTYDWDKLESKWQFRATNNPASLFLYVLIHPANAYRIADWDSPQFHHQIAAKVDLEKLKEWHNFCNPDTPTANNPRLTYNSVLTTTQSVMDTLRDICAAGKASPIFVDGKWSVVIDKLRTNVIQHFTPHNSWGFEANKTLPRLPHAFRITIQDEENAYQAKELYSYNYGYSMYDGYIVDSVNFAANINYTITELGTTTQAQWNSIAGTTGIVYTKGSTFTATGAGVGTGKAFTAQGTSGLPVKAAEIFEELNLPGVTNETQALHLAQWHLAQLKLRPETYTINTDFEYLVCNRGDLVKITHDVPLWGIASGRIKAINRATNTLIFTEELTLAVANNYIVRLRTNTGSSVLLNVASITTAGYYTSVNTVQTIPDSVEVDNLFMFGNNQQETQDLIVVSIEPNTNMSARITLVDYSPEIYSENLNSQLLTYSPNVTKPTTGTFNTTIASAPVINSVISSRETSQEISAGIYQTSSLVSFSNTGELTEATKLVQFELVRSDEAFNATNPAAFTWVTKESGNVTFNALQAGYMYKLRARYTDQAGSVFGPWSSTTSFVAGPAGIEPPTPTITLDLEGTYIVAAVPQTLVKPADFLTFEYRLYKDTGIEDFWELVPDSINNIKVIQSTTSGRFNLLDMPSPRISQAGITYRIACRTVNRNNEYSSQSALGTIVVTTIT